MSEDEMNELERSSESGYSSEESVNSPLEESPKSKFHYNTDVITKETPCYMKDFYEETVLPPHWCNLTDEQKRKILDDELDQYKNNK